MVDINSFPAWNQFKNKFKKKYETDAEDLYRKSVYEFNVQNIINLNSQDNTHYIDVTSFSDETEEESLNLHTGIKMPINFESLKHNSVYPQLETGLTLPTSYDAGGFATKSTKRISNGSPYFKKH